MVPQDAIKGKYFDFTGGIDGIITFFDVRGQGFPNGVYLVSYSEDEPLRRLHYSDLGVAARVQACIKEAVAAKQRKRIAQIQLDPESAVKFFLEGYLTVAHLEKAETGKDFIDIPNVKVGRGRGRFTLTVRILANPETPITVADSAGTTL